MAGNVSTEADSPARLALQISIARALLRRSNVFVADEATASVDFATDERVSKTLGHMPNIY